jgi:hypothetical protein
LRLGGHIHTTDRVRYLAFFLTVIVIVLSACSRATDSSANTQSGPMAEAMKLVKEDFFKHWGHCGSRYTTEQSVANETYFLQVEDIGFATFGEEQLTQSDRLNGIQFQASISPVGKRVRQYYFRSGKWEPWQEISYQCGVYRVSKVNDQWQLNAPCASCIPVDCDRVPPH